MKTKITCDIAGHSVIITENAVKTNNISLQIELVKRLIECKGTVTTFESALPLFFNKYLRHYPLNNLELISLPEFSSLKKEDWNNLSKNIAA